MTEYNAKFSGVSLMTLKQAWSIPRDKFLSRHGLSLSLFITVNIFSTIYSFFSRPAQFSQFQMAQICKKNISLLSFDPDN